MSQAQTHDAALPGISPGVYDQSDFVAVAAIAHAEAGIDLNASKAMLVYSRLAPLVRSTGCNTFAAFIELIRRDPEQRNRAIGALTTNHTFFYREAHHYRHFAETVRPLLLRLLDAEKSVRLWSAGCSSGEEVWSLAMTLLGEDRAIGESIARRNIRLLASDIADQALHKARAGLYGTADLEQVPASFRANWVEGGPEEASIGETARKLVRFRTLNLLAEWPMQRSFEVIFCRNVMIYFDTPTKERLLARLADRLSPGGYLYLGHSERATGPVADLLDPVGPTIYRRNGS